MTKSPSRAPYSVTGKINSGLSLQELHSISRNKALTKLRTESQAIDLKARGFTDDQAAQALSISKQDFQLLLREQYVDQALANREQTSLDRKIAVHRLEQALQALHAKAFGQDSSEWADYYQSLLQEQTPTLPTPTSQEPNLPTVREWLKVAKELHTIQGLREVTVNVQDKTDPDARAKFEAIAKNPGVLQAARAAQFEAFKEAQYEALAKNPEVLQAIRAAQAKKIPADLP